MMRLFYLVVTIVWFVIWLITVFELAETEYPWLWALALVMMSIFGGLTGILGAIEDKKCSCTKT